MTWRRRRNLKKRSMERSEVSIYLTYLAYEGIFDATEHFSESSNPFFIGANKAFRSMRKFYSIEEVKILLYKAKCDLENKGGRVVTTKEGAEIEFQSQFAQIMKDKRTIKKAEKDLWALSGEICATEYVLCNLQNYKKRLDDYGNTNKKSI